ncbi:MAG: BTAD domain-containing putative transcriptional regulator [Acidimicrobiales bacterium]
MRVGVLGPVEIEGNGELSPRDRVVLSVLVVHGHEVVANERLADALWGDEPPASAGKVVQGCIVRLRKALGPTSIETHSTGYRLSLGDDDVDLHRFERLLGRAREQLALRAPDRALRTAEEALALWRGRPFDDVDGWDAARIEASRLEELRLEAEDLRLDAALRSGRHTEVLATARRMVDAAPTRERRWELLALAQYRSGSQADALRTLLEARRQLAQELGLDPGPGIIGLEQSILNHDTELQAPTIAAVVDDTCPWPGLLAYSVDDADGFAGRDREIDDALARLASDGVLVVVGPSGSGKSSLVRAGVCGKLLRDGQRVVVMTPGPRPLEALRRRELAGAVLVVDQCEEAVTACDDEAQRDGFFALIAEHAAWHAPLVVSLRADRLGDLSSHADFARLVERGLFLLGPMDEPGLRAAIERPAHAAGLLLEPGLVDLVVRDVLDEPGALPLMSHALQQTWLRREGRTLTVAGYTETGGIRTAVARSAEAVYAALDRDDQTKLRDLLLRLVTPVEDGAPARTRLPRGAIAGDAGYQRLVEQLVDARLLTTDGEVVELAHEALARAWPRFHDWQAEDREGARTLRHLNSAAAGWDVLRRPDSELYRGERLAGVVDWQERSDPDLTATEVAFLDASVARQRAELQAAEVQVEHERQSVRRLRRLVTGVASFAVVALLATVLALQQRNAADDQARIAEARELAAEALEARPYDRALLLAVEAVRRWDDPETQGALLTTIARSPRITGMIRGADGVPFRRLDVAPSGERLVTSDAAGAVGVYDIATREVFANLPTDTTVRGSPNYSPDGDSIAMTSSVVECSWRCTKATNGVEVRDADDVGADPIRFLGLEDGPTTVVWSPDGMRVAAAAPFLENERSSDPIAVWDVDRPGNPTQTLVPRFVGEDFRPIPGEGTPAWLAFARDGQTLYASGAGPVSVLDIASGRVETTIDGLGGLALSDDGTTIAVRSDTARSVQLLDTATGATTAELRGHEDIVTTASFSADGTLLATASLDETIGIWDVASGDRIAVLRGHAGSITDVAFDDTAAALYSTAADRSLVTWDLDGSAGLAEQLAAPSIDVARESTVVVSPAGDRLAVLLEQSMRLVDVETGAVLDVPSLRGHTPTWASFSPDGERVAAIDSLGQPRLWRTDDGELLVQGPLGSQGYGAIAFSADGRSVLTSDLSGDVVEHDGVTLERTGRSIELGPGEPALRLWTGPEGRFAVARLNLDTNDGTALVFGDIDQGTVNREVHLDGAVLRGGFSAEGGRFAWGATDGRVGVIDVGSGEVAGPSDPMHTGPVEWVAFSPDGETLATLGFDGLVALSSADDARPRARLLPGAVNLNGALLYGPDGHTVEVVYRDGSALRFDTDPATWIAHACAVAGRNLNEDEWRDAFGDEPRRSTCE